MIFNKVIYLVNHLTNNKPMRCYIKIQHYYREENVSDFKSAADF